MKNIDFSRLFAEYKSELCSDAVADYLISELEGLYFDSLSSLTRNLYTAHCAAGSYSGVIYNRDIDDKIAQVEWRDAIESAREEYEDCTGEEYSFKSFGEALWFAIEWRAHQLAMYTENMDNARLVTIAVDSCDPSPDFIAFTTVWEAEEFLSETIQARIDYIVQHSPYPISERELEEISEQESQLVTMEQLQ